MIAALPPSLVPDCGGPIRTIAFTLPAPFFADDRTEGCVSPLVPIGNLLSALPSDVTALVLIDHACLASAQNWLDRLAIPCVAELVPLNGNDSVSHPWIQDMFHVRVGGNGVVTELMSAVENAVAGRLANHLGVATAASHVTLPGGNQLVGPDFRLVGHSSLQDDRGITSKTTTERPQQWQRVQALDSRTVHSFGYRPEDLSNASASIDLSLIKTPLPAIAAGKMHQCGFHVDQFVSVTGLQSDDRPLLLVADPLAHTGCDARAATDLKRKLDASALSLARQGFAIARNPIPVSPAIDNNKCLPRLYNNVLVENIVRSGQTRPFVWIPHFGDVEALDGFDEDNRQLWEKLGFYAIGVSGWSHFASRNGALRCATKVINRDPA
ncbi:hypothetical protein [Agrobacterium arsenijevicii]|uniref:Uncharacterized protein n=1 Tax=Agrobacterium arsenijevicii TaxID=1585697 RepID=A0ABR5D7U8_9HYPH|nr:hypothetical protein RP75_12860 [Agrobacterium arsenijevicii]